jgi:hypothetical protein
MNTVTTYLKLHATLARHLAKITFNFNRKIFFKRFFNAIIILKCKCLLISNFIYFILWIFDSPMFAIDKNFFSASSSPSSSIILFLLEFTLFWPLTRASSFSTSLSLFKFLLQLKSLPLTEFKHAF